MINGMSIKDDMTAIRQDLGVCPQFDILWPEITVKEHLMLYAAIKGFSRQQQLQEATDAANNVGRPLHAHLTVIHDDSCRYNRHFRPWLCNFKSAPPPGAASGYTSSSSDT